MSENNTRNDGLLEFVFDDDQDKLNEVIHGTLSNMSQNREDRKILGDESQDLDKDDEIAKNLRAIKAIYGNEDFSRLIALAVNRDTVHVRISSGGNVLGEGEDKDTKKIAEEKKLRKQIINEALEAAKHEVLMFYARDKKFASHNDEQKRRILEDSISDVFNFKMAKAVAASAIKDADVKEGFPKTKENENYTDQSLADMRAALEAFYSKKPVKVAPKQILNTTVHTSDAMDDYEADLRAKNLGKSANQFNQTKEEYNEKRRSFWGAAFDFAKNVWRGIKQSKARIITDASVVLAAGLGASSLGVAGLMALGVSAVAAPVVAPIAAAAGMGAYFAASSYAWLINDERRNQKAKSDDKAKWIGFNGMKNAWNSIKSDENKKSTFLRQGTITAVAGVAGAGLFGVAASSIGLAAGRIVSGAARAVGSVANQGTNWALAAKEYKKDASEENKAARDSARTGFWVSAGAAVLTNAVAAYFGLNNDTTTDVKVDDIKADDIKVDDVKADDIKADDIKADDIKADDVKADDVKADDVKVDDIKVSEVKVPTEWNSDMGISQDHWNEMHDKITGIYKDHADIFGMKNVSPEEAMKNMYQNIENARGAGYFEGQTNEEVLYKYVKLIEQTERAEVLKGTKYLVTKLDAEGEPMYWVNAEQMKALNHIIICGEKVEISADSLGKTLALINDHGKYTGEGANIGVTNNRYVGGRYDCDEYQNAWKKGAFAHKHPHIQHPEPAKVEEITINNDKPLEQAKVEEVTVEKKTPEKMVSWQEQKYTTGDNTVDSQSGSHAPKIIKHGVAPESAVRTAMAQQGLGGRS